MKSAVGFRYEMLLTKLLNTSEEEGKKTFKVVDIQQKWERKFSTKVG